VVFAGCLVPLTLGIYWKKANTPGALAAIIIGSVLRLILFYQIPEHLAGLDTMIAPVVSLIVMVIVSLMTQKSYPPKHHVINEVPDDAYVIAGICSPSVLIDEKPVGYFGNLCNRSVPNSG
jgi:SSS family solute:Na+ symporter